MTQASDFKKWDCVRLEWSDPAGLPGAWEPVTKKSMDVAGCVTVGQVYKVWPDRVTVICSWDSGNKHANGGVTILYSLIKDHFVLWRKPCEASKPST